MYFFLIYRITLIISVLNLGKITQITCKTTVRTCVLELKMNTNFIRKCTIHACVLELKMKLSLRPVWEHKDEHTLHL